MEDFAIIPTSGAEGYSTIDNAPVELSRKTSGKLIRKHILTVGDLRHPATGKIIPITEDTLTTIKKNFESNVCPIVQVPLADKNNAHTEAPDANTGEVVDLEIKDGKLYSIIDARKHAEDFGKTILGASAMLSLDYTNTATGEKVGPTLLHVAATNRPWVTDLEDYEEIIAASNSLSTDSNNEAVILETVAPAEEEKTSLSEEEHNPQVVDDKETIKMTKEELISALKDEHGIDVEALQLSATEAEKVAELANALKAELSDVVQLSASDVSVETIVSEVTGAFTAAKEENLQLSNRIDALEKTTARKDAEHEVDDLIGKAFIEPTKRDAMIELKLSNPDIYSKLIPEAPVLKLSQEEGTDELTPEQEEEFAREEVARLSSLVK